MLYIGIDPGQAGAIALADEKEVHTVELLSELGATWLSQAVSHSRCHVYLEKAQAMPGQGVTSMFNYGAGFGRILGWLEVLKLPHTLVTPREWTKEMHKGCTGESAKEKSLQAAQRLFPHMNLLASPRSKKPHQGIVDALLIAEFCRRQLVGK